MLTAGHMSSRGGGSCCPCRRGWGSAVPPVGGWSGRQFKPKLLRRELSGTSVHISGRTGGWTPLGFPPGFPRRFPVPGFEMLSGLWDELLDYDALPQPDGAIFRQASQGVVGKGVGG